MNTYKIRGVKCSVASVILAMATVASNRVWGDSKPSIVLELKAGECDRQTLLIEAELPNSVINQESFYLKRTDNEKRVPIQEISTSPTRIAWMLQDPLAAGATRTYELRPHTRITTDRGGVVVRDDGRRLVIESNERPVLAYNHATVPSPDSKHPYYARSGHLHPVYAPGGQILTDDFNPDHAHHHGIMFAWRKGSFEGRSTNPWHQAEETGRVEHVETEQICSGPVFGQFTAKLRQTDLTAPDGPRAVLNETRTVRVSNQKDVFVFDVEMVQTCASESPYNVEKMHYGGFAIRGSKMWAGHKTPVYEFLTDLGKDRETGNQSRAHWVRFSGVIDGKLAGMVVFSHPDNFRSPQPVRLHPHMPYFCFSPASLGAFQIVPGTPYVSRYRVVCYTGKIDEKQITQQWNNYADPPGVSIVSAPGP